MAHRVNLRQRSNSVAFGAKRTSSEHLREELAAGMSNPRPRVFGLFGTHSRAREGLIYYPYLVANRTGKSRTSVTSALLRAVVSDRAGPARPVRSSRCVRARDGDNCPCPKVMTTAARTAGAWPPRIAGNPLAGLHESFSDSGLAAGPTPFAPLRSSHVFLRASNDCPGPSCSAAD
jgi:hypothetical protein